MALVGSTEIMSERLRTALEHLGVSQTELARRSGIPKGSICQYMSGHVKPKSDRIYLICKALGIDEAYLMGYDVQMMKQKRTFVSNEEIKDILADGLSEKETILIERYRQADEQTKGMVDRLLAYYVLMKEAGNGEA